MLRRKHGSSSYTTNTDNDFMIIIIIIFMRFDGIAIILLLFVTNILYRMYTYVLHDIVLMLLFELLLKLHCILTVKKIKITFVVYSFQGFGELPWNFRDEIITFSKISTYYKGRTRLKTLICSTSLFINIICALYYITKIKNQIIGFRLINTFPLLFNDLYQLSTLSYCNVQDNSLSIKFLIITTHFTSLKFDSCTSKFSKKYSTLKYKIKNKFCHSKYDILQK
ncbi:hypothetical protein AGLY_000715 [Aphis glycines]|uniref:Uncharacterized protein n=1 Tax=Aphis glycines TaxID=307491 RepID=A0A6G0UA50_APHGL|nr:hypothetical protein AGLY_000715 [Aphis glycines]